MSRARRAATRLVVLLSGLAILLGAARPAGAHGGQVWIDETSGRFHLVVQTNPTTTDRRVRFTIVVTQPDAGDAIADANVHLHAELAGSPAQDVVVPPESGQPGFYDGPLTVPAYGDWRVAVRVQRATDAGTATFTLPLRQPTVGESALWVLAFLPLLIGVAVFLYFWRTPPKAPLAPASEDDAPATP